jgi:hypothetical protein
MNGAGDVPTVLVRDGDGRQLLCFLEQLIPLDGKDYALLTPVDTPVCLVRIATDEDGDDEVIDELDGAEPILSVADVVLQEHDLTLVRSAVTLTVLIQFRAEGEEYGLFIPLDPFFVVARMENGEGILVEGEEFERVQPRIEAELDERELGER